MTLTILTIAGIMFYERLIERLIVDMEHYWMEWIKPTPPPQRINLRRSTRKRREPKRYGF